MLHVVLPLLPSLAAAVCGRAQQHRNALLATIAWVGLAQRNWCRRCGRAMPIIVLHFPCSRGRVLAPGVLNDAPSPPACLPACFAVWRIHSVHPSTLCWGSSRQLVGGCVLPDGAGQHVPSSMQSTAARMRLIVRYQEGSGPAAATAKRSIQTRPNNNSIHPLHPPTQPTAHRLWGQCPSPLSSWGRACPTSTGNSRVRRRGLPATGHAAAAAAARSVRPNRQPPPPSPPPLQ